MNKTNTHRRTAYAALAACAIALGALTGAVTASAQDSEGVVNIQTATADQLQLLPGIGPSKADAIVAQRERRAFRRIEDLMRVRGIGRATFRRVRSMLTVTGPTTLAPPTARTAAATAPTSTQR